MNVKMTNERITREFDSMKKLVRERDDDARRKIETLERRNKELEADLHRLDSQYKTVLDKGVKQKDISDKMSQLEIDYRNMKNQNKLLED
jgi:hypothetical protein